MSKKTLSVTLKNTKMGWCVLLDGEPYAIGSHAYCQEVSKGLILRCLRYGPDFMPTLKGGAA